MVAEGGFCLSLTPEPECYRTVPSSDHWWTCNVSDVWFYATGNLELLVTAAQPSL